MKDNDKNFTGSIPEIYDTYLVPLIFAAYGEDTARRTAALAPMVVLETASGSGVVTRALAPLLAPKARYTVTDISQPMLDHASRRQGTDDRITWRQADALKLPFDDGSFDAVVCQFGAMFFPDKAAGFAEARRVLKPGGRYLVTVWDRIEANEFAAIMTDAAASMFPSDPPRFLARTPHGYNDVDVIRGDFDRAGFSQVTITTRPETSRAPSPRHPAIGFCQGSPLRGEIEARGGSVDEVTDRGAEAIAKKHGNGPVAGKIQAHIIEAVR